MATAWNISTTTCPAARVWKFTVYRQEECYNEAMNDDVISDLKQFIAATVSQSTAELREEFSGLRQEFSGLKQDFSGLRQEFSGLKQEMNQRFDDLNDKVDAIADAHATDLTDHEQRISRLEQQAA